MNWKKQISKFSGRMTGEKWLFLLLLGVFFMILSFPAPGNRKKEAEKALAAETEPQTQTVSAAPAASSYEAQLEARIEEILKSVDGVGKADVMVVLKSSGEKVMHMDRTENENTTKERDSSGGEREAVSSQKSETTVMASGGNGAGSAPVVEKELTPEISGIIISAQGGGSPAVQAEISGAMEALFGLPPHKIKVLKRVE
jgi:stage III sporulation protein AG